MLHETQLRTIVRDTVKETLTGLGFSAHDPQEMQRDLVHLRKIRTGSEELSRKVRTTLIALSVTSVVYAVWEAVKKAVLS